MQPQAASGPIAVYYLLIYFTNWERDQFSTLYWHHYKCYNHFPPGMQQTLSSAQALNKNAVLYCWFSCLRSSILWNCHVKCQIPWLFRANIHIYIFPASVHNFSQSLYIFLKTLFGFMAFSDVAKSQVWPNMAPTRAMSPPFRTARYRGTLRRGLSDGAACGGMVVAALNGVDHRCRLRKEKMQCWSFVSSSKTGHSYAKGQC